MFGRRKRHALPEREKEELKTVQRRLDVLEPKVNFLETQYRLMRRETP